MLLNCGVGEDSWESFRTARSNQLILKEISPEYSLEGLMKLNFQYVGYLIWRANSLEKTLMWGKIESKRRRGGREWNGWMASPIRWTWVWVSSGCWWWIGKLGVLQFVRSQRVRHNWATELNWKGNIVFNTARFTNIQPEQSYRDPWWEGFHAWFNVLH